MDMEAVPDLLEQQPPLLPHKVLMLRDQPFGRPSPELIEMMGYVEHAPIKT